MESKNDCLKGRRTKSTLLKSFGCNITLKYEQVFFKESECKIESIRDLAQSLLRFINTTTKKTRKTTEFLHKVQNKLKFLQDCIEKFIKAKCKFPYTRSLNKLLARYIALEGEIYEVQGKKLDKMEEANSRILYIFNIMLSVMKDVKNRKGKSELFIGKIFTLAMSLYKIEKDFCRNLVTYVLSNLGASKNVEDLCKQPVLASKLWYNLGLNSLVNLNQFETDSEYSDSDDCVQDSDESDSEMTYAKMVVCNNDENLLKSHIYVKNENVKTEIGADINSSPSKDKTKRNEICFKIRKKLPINGTHIRNRSTKIIDSSDVIEISEDKEDDVNKNVKTDKDEVDNKNKIIQSSNNLSHCPNKRMKEELNSKLEKFKVNSNDGDLVIREDDSPKNNQINTSKPSGSNVGNKPISSKQKLDAISPTRKIESSKPKELEVLNSPTKENKTPKQEENDKNSVLQNENHKRISNLPEQVDTSGRKPKQNKEDLLNVVVTDKPKDSKAASSIQSPKHDKPILLNDGSKNVDKADTNLKISTPSSSTIIKPIYSEQSTSKILEKDSSKSVLKNPSEKLNSSKEDVTKKEVPKSKAKDKISPAERNLSKDQNKKEDAQKDLESKENEVIKDETTMTDKNLTSIESASDKLNFVKRIPEKDEEVSNEQQSPKEETQLKNILEPSISNDASNKNILESEKSVHIKVHEGMTNPKISDLDQKLIESKSFKEPVEEITETVKKSTDQKINSKSTQKYEKSVQNKLQEDTSKAKIAELELIEPKSSNEKPVEEITEIVKINSKLTQKPEKSVQDKVHEDTTNVKSFELGLIKPKSSNEEVKEVIQKPTQEVNSKSIELGNNKIFKVKSRQNTNLCSSKKQINMKEDNIKASVSERIERKDTSKKEISTPKNSRVFEAKTFDNFYQKILGEKQSLEENTTISSGSASKSTDNKISVDKPIAENKNSVNKNLNEHISTANSMDFGKIKEDSSTPKLPNSDISSSKEVFQMKSKENLMIEEIKNSSKNNPKEVEETPSNLKQEENLEASTLKSTQEGPINPLPIDNQEGIQYNFDIVGKKKEESAKIVEKLIQNDQDKEKSVQEKCVRKSSKKDNEFEKNIEKGTQKCEEKKGIQEIIKPNETETLLKENLFHNPIDGTMILDLHATEIKNTDVSKNLEKSQGESKTVIGEELLKENDGKIKGLEEKLKDNILKPLQEGIETIQQVSKDYPVTIKETLLVPVKTFEKEDEKVENLQSKENPLEKCKQQNRNESIEKQADVNLGQHPLNILTEEPNKTILGNLEKEKLLDCTPKEDENILKEQNQAEGSDIKKIADKIVNKEEEKQIEEQHKQKIALKHSIDKIMATVPKNLKDNTLVTEYNAKIQTDFNCEKHTEERIGEENEAQVKSMEMVVDVKLNLQKESKVVEMVVPNILSSVEHVLPETAFSILKIEESKPKLSKNNEVILNILEEKENVSKFGIEEDLKQPSSAKVLLKVPSILPASIEESLKIEKREEIEKIATVNNKIKVVKNKEFETHDSSKPNKANSRAKNLHTCINKLIKRTEEIHGATLKSSDGSKKDKKENVKNEDTIVISEKNLEQLQENELFIEEKNIEERNRNQIDISKEIEEDSIKMNQTVQNEETEMEKCDRRKDDSFQPEFEIFFKGCEEKQEIEPIVQTIQIVGNEEIVQDFSAFNAVEEKLNSNQNKADYLSQNEVTSLESSNYVQEMPSDSIVPKEPPMQPIELIVEDANEVPLEDVVVEVIAKNESSANTVINNFYPEILPSEISSFSNYDVSYKKNNLDNLNTTEGVQPEDDYEGDEEDALICDVVLDDEKPKYENPLFLNEADSNVLEEEKDKGTLNNDLVALASVAVASEALANKKRRGRRAKNVSARVDGILNILNNDGNNLVTTKTKAQLKAYKKKEENTSEKKIVTPTRPIRKAKIEAVTRLVNDLPYRVKNLLKSTNTEIIPIETTYSSTSNQMEETQTVAGATIYDKIEPNLQDFAKISPKKRWGYSAKQSELNAKFNEWNQIPEKIRENLTIEPVESSPPVNKTTEPNSIIWPVYPEEILPEPSVSSIEDSCLPLKKKKEVKQTKQESSNKKSRNKKVLNKTAKQVSKFNLDVTPNKQKDKKKSKQENGEISTSTYNIDNSSLFDQLLAEYNAEKEAQANKSSESDNSYLESKPESEDSKSFEIAKPKRKQKKSESEKKPRSRSSSYHLEENIIFDQPETNERLQRRTRRANVANLWEEQKNSNTEKGSLKNATPTRKKRDTRQNVLDQPEMETEGKSEEKGETPTKSGRKKVTRAKRQTNKNKNVNLNTLQNEESNETILNEETPKRSKPSKTENLFLNDEVVSESSSSDKTTQGNKTTKGKKQPKEEKTIQGLFNSQLAENKTSKPEAEPETVKEVMSELKVDKTEIIVEKTIKVPNKVASKKGDKRKSFEQKLEIPPNEDVLVESKKRTSSRRSSLTTKSKDLKVDIPENKKSKSEENLIRASNDDSREKIETSKDDNSKITESLIECSSSEASIDKLTVPKEEMINTIESEMLVDAISAVEIQIPEDCEVELSTGRKKSGDIKEVKDNAKSQKGKLRKSKRLGLERKSSKSTSRELSISEIIAEISKDEENKAKMESKVLVETSNTLQKEFETEELSSNKKEVSTNKSAIFTSKDCKDVYIVCEDISKSSAFSEIQGSQKMNKNISDSSKGNLTLSEDQSSENILRSNEILSTSEAVPLPWEKLSSSLEDKSILIEETSKMENLTSKKLKSSEEPKSPEDISAISKETSKTFQEENTSSKKKQSENKLSTPKEKIKSSKNKISSTQKTEAPKEENLITKNLRSKNKLNLPKTSAASLNEPKKIKQKSVSQKNKEKEIDINIIIIEEKSKDASLLREKKTDVNEEIIEDCSKEYLIEKSVKSENNVSIMSKNLQDVTEIQPKVFEEILISPEDLSISENLETLQPESKAEPSTSKNKKLKLKETESLNSTKKLERQIGPSQPDLPDKILNPKNTIKELKPNASKAFKEEDPKMKISQEKVLEEVPTPLFELEKSAKERRKVKKDNSQTSIQDVNVVQEMKKPLPKGKDKTKEIKNENDSIDIKVSNIDTNKSEKKLQIKDDLVDKSSAMPDGKRENEDKKTVKSKINEKEDPPCVKEDNSNKEQNKVSAEIIAEEKLERSIKSANSEINIIENIIIKASAVDNSSEKQNKVSEENKAKLEERDKIVQPQLNKKQILVTEESATAIIEDKSIKNENKGSSKKNGKNNDELEKKKSGETGKKLKSKVTSERNLAIEESSTKFKVGKEQNKNVSEIILNNVKVEEPKLEESNKTVKSKKGILEEIEKQNKLSKNSKPNNDESTNLKLEESIADKRKDLETNESPAAIIEDNLNKNANIISAEIVLNNVETEKPKLEESNKTLKPQTNKNGVLETKECATEIMEVNSTKKQNKSSKTIGTNIAEPIKLKIEENNKNLKSKDSKSRNLENAESPKEIVENISIKQNKDSKDIEHLDATNKTKLEENKKITKKAVSKSKETVKEPEISPLVNKKEILETKESPAEIKEVNLTKTQDTKEINNLIEENKKAVTSNINREEVLESVASNKEENSNKKQSEVNNDEVGKIILEENKKIYKKVVSKSKETGTELKEGNLNKKHKVPEKIGANNDEPDKIKLAESKFTENSETKESVAQIEEDISSKKENENSLKFGLKTDSEGIGCKHEANETKSEEIKKRDKSQVNKKKVAETKESPSEIKDDSPKKIQNKDTEKIENLDEAKLEENNKRSKSQVNKKGDTNSKESAMEIIKENIIQKQNKVPGKNDESSKEENIKTVDLKVIKTEDLKTKEKVAENKAGPVEFKTVQDEVQKDENREAVSAINKKARKTSSERKEETSKNESKEVKTKSLDDMMSFVSPSRKIKEDFKNLSKEASKIVGDESKEEKNSSVKSTPSIPRSKSKGSRDYIKSDATKNKIVTTEEIVSGNESSKNAAEPIKEVMSKEIAEKVIISPQIKAQEQTEANSKEKSIPNERKQKKYGNKNTKIIVNEINEENTLSFEITLSPEEKTRTPSKRKLKEEPKELSKTKKAKVETNSTSKSTDKSTPVENAMPFLEPYNAHEDNRSTSDDMPEISKELHESKHFHLAKCISELSEKLGSSITKDVVVDRFEIQNKDTKKIGHLDERKLEEKSQINKKGVLETKEQATEIKEINLIQKQKKKSEDIIYLNAKLEENKKKNNKAISVTKEERSLDVSSKPKLEETSKRNKSEVIKRGVLEIRENEEDSTNKKRKRATDQINEKHRAIDDIFKQYMSPKQETESSSQKEILENSNANSSKFEISKPKNKQNDKEKTDILKSTKENSFASPIPSLQSDASSTRNLKKCPEKETNIESVILQLGNISKVLKTESTVNLQPVEVIKMPEKILERPKPNIPEVVRMITNDFDDDLSNPDSITTDPKLESKEVDKQPNAIVEMIPQYHELTSQIELSKNISHVENNHPTTENNQVPHNSNVIPMDKVETDVIVPIASACNYPSTNEAQSLTDGIGGPFMNSEVEEHNLKKFEEKIQKDTIDTSPETFAYSEQESTLCFPFIVPDGNLTDDCCLIPPNTSENMFIPSIICKIEKDTEESGLEDSIDSQLEESKEEFVDTQMEEPKEYDEYITEIMSLQSKEPKGFDKYITEIMSEEVPHEILQGEVNAQKDLNDANLLTGILNLFNNDKSEEFLSNIEVPNNISQEEIIAEEDSNLNQDEETCAFSLTDNQNVKGSPTEQNNLNFIGTELTLDSHNSQNVEDSMQEELLKNKIDTDNYLTIENIVASSLQSKIDTDNNLAIECIIANSSQSNSDGTNSFPLDNFGFEIKSIDLQEIESSWTHENIPKHTSGFNDSMSKIVPISIGSIFPAQPSNDILQTPRTIPAALEDVELNLNNENTQSKEEEIKKGKSNLKTSQQSKNVKSKPNEQNSKEKKNIAGLSKTSLSKPDQSPTKSNSNSPKIGQSPSQIGQSSQSSSPDVMMLRRLPRMKVRAPERKPDFNNTNTTPTNSSTESESEEKYKRKSNRRTTDNQNNKNFIFFEDKNLKHDFLQNLNEIDVVNMKKESFDPKVTMKKEVQNQAEKYKTNSMKIVKPDAPDVPYSSSSAKQNLNQHKTGFNNINITSSNSSTERNSEEKSNRNTMDHQTNQNFVLFENKNLKHDFLQNLNEIDVVNMKKESFDTKVTMKKEVQNRDERYKTNSIKNVKPDAPEVPYSSSSAKKNLNQHKTAFNNINVTSSNSSTERNSQEIHKQKSNRNTMDHQSNQNFVLFENKDLKHVFIQNLNKVTNIKKDRYDLKNTIVQNPNDKYESNSMKRTKSESSNSPCSSSSAKRNFHQHKTDSESTDEFESNKRTEKQDQKQSSSSVKTSKENTKSSSKQNEKGDKTSRGKNKHSEIIKEQQSNSSSNNDLDEFDKMCKQDVSELPIIENGLLKRSKEEKVKKSQIEESNRHENRRSDPHKKRSHEFVDTTRYDSRASTKTSRKSSKTYEKSDDDKRSSTKHKVGYSNKGNSPKIIDLGKVTPKLYEKEEGRHRKRTASAASLEQQKDDGDSSDNNKRICIDKDNEVSKPTAKVVPTPRPQNVGQYRSSSNYFSQPIENQRERIRRQDNFQPYSNQEQSDRRRSNVSRDDIDPWRPPLYFRDMPIRCINIGTFPYSSRGIIHEQHRFNEHSRQSPEQFSHQSFSSDSNSDPSMQYIEGIEHLLPPPPVSFSSPRRVYNTNSSPKRKC